MSNIQELSDEQLFSIAGLQPKQPKLEEMSDDDLMKIAQIPVKPSERGADFQRPEESQVTPLIAGAEGFIEGASNTLPGKIIGGALSALDTTQKALTAPLKSGANFLQEKARENIVYPALKAIGAPELSKEAKNTISDVSNAYTETVGDLAGDVVLGKGIEKAAPIIAGKTIEKTGKAIQAPMKFSRWFSDRLMDTSLGMKKSDRAKFLKDNYAGEDASQWANDRGLFGNQEQIAEKLDSIKKQSYDALNDSIEGIKGTNKHETTQRVLNKLKEQFNKNTSLSEANIKLSDQIDSLYQKSLKDGLTLSENLKVKRLIDEIISPFKPSGDVKSGIEWQDLSRARNEIKSFIEDVASKNGVKNVRELSKDIQLSTLMSKAIKFGNVTGKTNRMLGLADFILTAALRDPILSTLGVGAKKIAEMPSVKTKVASILRNLSGDELKQFEVMKMNGKQPENSVYKNIVNYIKQVGVNLEKKGNSLYNKQEESRKVSGLLPARPHVIEMPNAIPVGKGSPKYPNALTKEMDMLPEEVAPVKETPKTGFTMTDHHKNVPAERKPMTVSEWRAKQRFQTKGKPYTPKEEEKIIDAEFVEHDTRTLPKRPLQIEKPPSVIALGNLNKVEKPPVKVIKQREAAFTRKQPKTMKQKLIEAKTEKKAESVKKEPIIMTEEQYLSSKGATFMKGADAALHRTPGGFPKGVREKLLSKVQDDMKKNNIIRSELREEYKNKINSGEIIEPTSTDRLIETANGDEMMESTQAARRLLDKKGIDWEKKPTPKTMKQLKEKWKKRKTA